MLYEVITLTDQGDFEAAIAAGEQSRCMTTRILSYNFV